MWNSTEFHLLCMRQMACRNVVVLVSRQVQPGYQKRRLFVKSSALSPLEWSWLDGLLALRLAIPSVEWLALVAVQLSILLQQIQLQMFHLLVSIGYRHRHQRLTWRYHKRLLYMDHISHQVEWDISWIGLCWVHSFRWTASSTFSWLQVVLLHPS